MNLRVILVGLVASMGLELPSERDLAHWAESGRDWACTRISGSPHAGLTAEPTDAAKRVDPAVVTLADADEAFAAANRSIVREFASDTAPAVVAASASVADSDAIVAESAVLATVGLPDGEEVATVISPVIEVATSNGIAPTVEVAAEPTETVVTDPATPSRADRLNEAVRLTREAAQAWADLIQDAADEASPAR